MDMNGWTQIGWHATDTCHICGGTAMIVSHPDGRVRTSAICGSDACNVEIMRNVSAGAQRYIANVYAHQVN